jgi:energy-coupling factor transporter ATP-binding protein EcfA2
MSDDILADLLVAYVANVGSSATVWLASRFKKAPHAVEITQPSKLNLGIQSRLHERGVDPDDASKVAELVLRTSHLGYFMMLVQEARQSPEYSSFPAEEIEAILSLELRISLEACRIAAKAIAEVLERALKSGVQDREFTEAVDVESELTAIQLFGAQASKRKFLESTGTADVHAIDVFNRSYRERAAQRFGTIHLHHLDNGSEELLKNLYVDPRFKSLDWWGDGEDQTVDSENILVQSARLVIIGPAGSGKSTAVRKLAASVANTGVAELTPVVIELRKYIANKALDTQTIIEYIKQSIKKFMQADVPDNWAEYILITGRAVVFFDGLDEVLEAGTRADVRDAVLSFAQVFPAASIVVTSRPTGYESAPFLDTEWSHFSVQPLEEDQVKDYASKWFKLKNPDANSKQKTKSFIEESREYAEDLRANPLMLSLLCSVYYVSGEIPRTLSSLYDRCADLIYRQWNTMRGIDDHRAWDADVRPVLYWVANTLIENKEYLSTGIAEDDLVAEIARASVANGAPSMEVAYGRARDTVRLWSGRAWIITAVMSGDSGRPRYGFVHQSFLEYFAAVYAVRRAETPEALFKSLKHRLVNQNGTTVAQIAVSVVQQWRDNGAERFISALLKYARKASETDRLALLRFSVS